jgi:hypothetical protein
MLETYIACLILLAQATMLTKAFRVVPQLGCSLRRFPHHQGAVALQTALRDSKTYLIEFRGMQPALRLRELTDAYNAVGSSNDMHASDRNALLLHMDPVISTFKSGGALYPVCGYVKFPSEEVAAAVANRCALVRSIVEVWGNAPSPEDVSIQAQERFDKVIAPIFPVANTAEKNSWRVNFRRYGRSGRSGLDFAEKRKLLETFNPILKKLGGNVNLTDARHDLIYLEDWSTFHDEVGETMSIQQNSTAAATVAAESSYKPLRSILGRIVAEGQNVQFNFDIKRRPYIGRVDVEYA